MSVSRASVIDLRPNRDLLNPHFESYKLSLDTFPSTEIKFDIDVAECYKPDTCYSFHHAKICSDFNALVVNCTGDGEASVAALFNSVGELVLVDIDNMFTQKIVWKVPNEASKQGLAISACFVRDDLLLIENGTGQVFLLEVKRSPELAVNVVWGGALMNEDTMPNAVIMDNAIISHNGSDIDFFSLAAESCNELPQWVRSKLASSNSRTQVSEESGFATSVYWHRLSRTVVDEFASWNIKCLGRFASSSVCSLAVPTGDDGLILGGERPFVNVMLPEEAEAEHKAVHGEGRLYSWHQDQEFVTLSFPFIHVNTKKEDVHLDIKHNSITVKVSSSDNIEGFELTGELGGEISVDSSTWILDESPEFVKDPYVDHRCAKKLEITLAKVEQGTTWVNCVIGDERGHMILNEDQLESVRDLTAPGTKHGRQSISIYDDDEPDDVNAKVCRNADDSENDAALQWFDESGKVAAVIYLGSPQSFLFSRSHPYTDICLKSDVDGCVWRPKAENGKIGKEQNGTSKIQRSLEHIATFDALAYVLGSKENRRFTSCTPDLRLAVAADCRHHVYVYRRPEAATLINRKSGAHETVSRQHVIAIDPPEESIIGFQVTNSAIFVLTPKRLMKFALAMAI